MQYDRLTLKIMRRVIGPGVNCVDIGSHDGDVLKKCIELAPKGRHFAFEPVPEYFERLDRVYGRKATVLPYALSDKSGTSVFHFVRNAPAYSGLKKRKYAVRSPEVKQIDVEVRRLDDLIAEPMKTGFIKIDVEGAELQVIKGAVNLIRRSSPVIVFEFGLGASDYYDAGPEDMYQVLTGQCGLKVSLLSSFVEGGRSLTEDQFNRHYHQKTAYYFVAHP